MVARELLQEIHRRITGAGGQLLLVGGCVRDRFFGVESKDSDVEVYRLSVEEIVRAMSGLDMDVVGKAFGVIKIGDVDLSVPRRENKVGVGHRAFDVRPDPFMTPQEAAARRDFTMNSLAQTLDGEVLDFYGGVQDINGRILRATSAQFVEDPLRVLRGMQFAARFGMEMESGTVQMCRSVAGEFSSLARERLWSEFEKLMSRGRQIGNGLEILFISDWLRLFPELSAMKGCLQDVEWHPEGDVWQHTLHVCDAASQIAEREKISPEERLVLMFAALLHDVGKPSTTIKNDQGRWTSPAHAEAGVAPAEKFLDSIGAPQWLVAGVSPLVREHMAHIGCEATPRVVRRLSARLTPMTINGWSRLVEADHSGRPPLPPGNPARLFVALAEQMEIASAKPTPLLMGRHLIELGLEPNPRFGTLLAEAYEVQLDQGWSDMEVAIGWMEERLGR